MRKNTDLVASAVYKWNELRNRELWNLHMRYCQLTNVLLEKGWFNCNSLLFFIFCWSVYTYILILIYTSELICVTSCHFLFFSTLHIWMWLPLWLRSEMLPLEDRAVYTCYEGPRRNFVTGTEGMYNALELYKLLTVKKLVLLFLIWNYCQMTPSYSLWNKLICQLTSPPFPQGNEIAREKILLCIILSIINICDNVGYFHSCHLKLWNFPLEMTSPLSSEKSSA